jgi:hypothetical protein
MQHGSEVMEVLNLQDSSHLNRNMFNSMVRSLALLEIRT